MATARPTVVMATVKRQRPVGTRGRHKPRGQLKITLSSKISQSAMEATTPTEILPTVELTSSTQLPESTNCLVCSEDGRYLTLGHSQGLSVWCASSLTCVAQWLQDRVEITSIQMTKMADTAYLLCSVDDMGVARVFVYHCEDIHLLTVINIMENVNKRSICLTFELSESGDYGAASFSCNGVLWLEVYHFPVEAWLKELEMVKAQEQDPTQIPNPSERACVEFSPVAALIKIHSPKAGADPLVSSVAEFLTYRLGLDISSTSGTQQEENTFHADVGQTKEPNGSMGRCTQHFLLPCGHMTPRSHSDVECVPDKLWPNAEEIVCSAVSRCSRYIALGLANGLVSVLDRRAGSQLSVVPTPESSFLRMQFLDRWPVSADTPQSLITSELNLLLLCRNGSILAVTTGRGTHPCVVQLTERPKHGGDRATVAAAMPFLQNSLLVVQRNGKVLLQDVVKRMSVCCLIPPASHAVASPCNPVYALNNRLQTLFIKGDQDPSISPSAEGGSQSMLFLVRFGESDIIKQCSFSLLNSPLNSATWEEANDLYQQRLSQQRAPSVDERNQALTWTRLQETAVKLQERQGRAATSK